MAKAVTVGTFTVDIIAYDLPKVADAGEVIYVDRPIDLYIGGHASNVALDLIKLNTIRDVVAVGALGRDVFARVIRNELSRYGIKVYPQIVENVGTARNVILVVRGEDRRFHIYKGANPYLTHDHVINALLELKPRYAYIALGVSEDLDSNIKDIVNVSKKVGTVLLIDVAYMNSSARQALYTVMHEVDIVHLNEYELRILLGKLDLMTALKRLSSISPRLLIVTLGERGVVALFKGDTVIYQQPFTIKAKDPTGAGDAFCAGIMTYIEELGLRISEASSEEIIRLLLFAQASGASATISAGATTSVRRDIVEGLIKEQGEELLNKTQVTDLK